MVINIQEWQDEYQKGVANKAEKWRRRFLATSGIAEKAKSDAAETAYAAGVQSAVSNKTRQKKLANVTDADIKGPVERGGSGLYSAPAQAKAPKAARGFAPYAPTIDSVTAGLPPRTADAAANVAARVTPLAVALQNQKRGR